MENKNEFHKASYILGLKSAIEQIENEYELCVMEHDSQLEKEEVKSKLRFTKMAFCRLTGLIEDQMIQYGEVFKRNLYVDQIYNLEDKTTWTEPNK